MVFNCAKIRCVLNCPTVSKCHNTGVRELLWQQIDGPQSPIVCFPGLNGIAVQSMNQNDTVKQVSLSNGTRGNVKIKEVAYSSCGNMSLSYSVSRPIIEPFFMASVLLAFLTVKATSEDYWVNLWAHDRCLMNLWLFTTANKLLRLRHGRIGRLRKRRCAAHACCTKRHSA